MGPAPSTAEGEAENGAARQPAPVEPFHTCEDAQLQDLRTSGQKRPTLRAFFSQGLFFSVFF